MCDARGQILYYTQCTDADSIGMHGWQEESILTALHFRSGVRWFRQTRALANWGGDEVPTMEAGIADRAWMIRTLLDTPAWALYAHVLPL